MIRENGAVVHPWPGMASGRFSTLREIWGARELLRTLTIRNLKIKYKRSVLGFVWTLLNPLVTVGVLVLVFGHVVRIGLPAYWAFLISGYFVWNFVSMSLNAGTRVLRDHSALARSVRIPPHIFVLAAVAARFVEFMVELVLVLGGLAIIHHGGVPIGFAVLPLLLLILLLLTVGLILPIATASAFYDDLQHVIPVGLLILFYASPVFYPVQMVPEHLQRWYLFNPLAYLLDAFHTALYEGILPAAGSLALLGAMAVALCAGGFALFNTYRRVFVEIV